MSNTSNFSRFSNKVAIVTGSGRGLGASAALRLASEGANIIVNDLNLENAKAVSAEIEKLGRKTLISQHDVSDYKAANALVEEATPSSDKSIF